MSIGKEIEDAAFKTVFLNLQKNHYFWPLSGEEVKTVRSWWLMPFPDSDKVMMKRWWADCSCQWGDDFKGLVNDGTVYIDLKTSVAFVPSNIIHAFHLPTLLLELAAYIYQLTLYLYRQQ